VPYGTSGKGPVLGITGLGSNQLIRIVDKDYAFLSPSPDWNLLGPFTALWDDNRDGVSDVDWALQVAGFLLEDGNVVVQTGDPADDANNYWPRTAVGLGGGGDVYLVIADGEGFTYRQGASVSELGLFFRNVLGAGIAMTFDGGGSTKLVMVGADGQYRLVNTPTSENPHTQSPYDSRVLDYLVTY
jgi:hypothetical protein